MRMIVLLKKAINVMKNSLSNSNICIIGIDGTGKTSICRELKKLLEADIQYMGYKYSLTSIARRRFESARHAPVKGTVSKTINLIIWIIEMWYRVIRHWPEENLVIYDRYTWERYIFHNGIEGVASKIFFKILFPKPKYVFYLYCPVNVSISRKTDINDIEEFKQLKEKFDAEFLKAKSVIVVNTQENTLDSALATVVRHLPEKLIRKRI